MNANELNFLHIISGGAGDRWIDAGQTGQWVDIYEEKSSDRWGQFRI